MVQVTYHEPRLADDLRPSRSRSAPAGGCSCRATARRGTHAAHPSPDRRPAIPSPISHIYLARKSVHPQAATALEAVFEELTGKDVGK